MHSSVFSHRGWTEPPARGGQWAWISTVHPTSEKSDSKLKNTNVTLRTVAGTEQALDSCYIIYTPYLVLFKDQVQITSHCSSTYDLHVFWVSPSQCPWTWAHSSVVCASVCNWTEKVTLQACLYERVFLIVHTYMCRNTYTHLLLDKKKICLIQKTSNSMFKCIPLINGTPLNSVWVLHTLLMAFLPLPALQCLGVPEGK